MSLPVLWAIIRVTILGMPLVAMLLQLTVTRIEQAMVPVEEDEQSSSIHSSLSSVQRVSKQPFLIPFQCPRTKVISLMESQLHEAIYLRKIKKKAPCRAGPFNST